MIKVAVLALVLYSKLVCATSTAHIDPVAILKQLEAGGVVMDGITVSDHTLEQIIERAYLSDNDFKNMVDSNEIEKTSPLKRKAA